PNGTVHQARRTRIFLGFYRQKSLGFPCSHLDQFPHPQPGAGDDREHHRRLADGRRRLLVRISAKEKIGGARMPDKLQRPADTPPSKRRMEIYAFFVVTAVLMPAFAVATVGTWGLTVWIYQAISGPPGPPSK